MTDLEKEIADEISIKVGSDLTWLGIVTIDLENRQIIAPSITKERNTFVAERFVSNIVRDHGKHHISTDDNTWYPVDVDS